MFTVLNNHQTRLLPPKVLPAAKPSLVSEMEKSGYRFIGRHSAMKVCHWTKQSIRGKGSCYKCKFYGIQSHQCIQMTPTVFWCNFNCPHCWRQHRYTLPPKDFHEWDDPKFIMDGCTSSQINMVQGFGGSETSDKKKLLESMKPSQVAISLAGEPTLYPYLPELIDEIISRNMTAFLVSNGTNPDVIESLLKHQPTNLYISFYGPNPEVYKRTAAPMVPDFWERVLKSISMLGEFKCNTVFRLTLSKLNMVLPQDYARHIEMSGTRFVECKGYMAVGGSRERLGPSLMPTHAEIKAFAQEIENHSSYKIVNEKPESSVVLLSRDNGNTDIICD